MTTTTDFVIAGGGHNSLITAAYLSKAGHEVVVLDARPEAGGGAATEEILLPGFGFDTCSTGQTLIQVNPVLAHDELGLISEFGLQYVEPDPVAHVVFPDGEHLTMWLDLDRTLEEIGRFSKHDAVSYRRMLDEFEEVKGVYGAYRFTPIGYGPSLDERLAHHPHGMVWMRRNVMSAWEVIRREFESRHIRAFMAWMAFQTAQPLDSPGSGYLAYSLIGGRQQRSWSIPLGGSASLPRATVAAIEKAGGEVITNTFVESLIIEGGRCVGVETERGDQYRARRGVVSSIHIKTLVGWPRPNCGETTSSTVSIPTTRASRLLPPTTPRPNRHDSKSMEGRSRWWRRDRHRGQKTSSSSAGFFAMVVSTGQERSCSSPLPRSSTHHGPRRDITP